MYKPLVSVIMPVYNASLYLKEALNSVFSQTYENIEVIAVNDGSTDNSLRILKAYAKKEPRLKVFSNIRNMGVGYTSNLAVKMADGAFIARLDADDLIPKDRIEKQVDFLLGHPRVVVVGGQVELVDTNGRTLFVKTFPTDHKKILDLAFLAMPIQQGAMMVNRDLLPKDFVWYRKTYKTSEDLDFFFRAFHYGQGANCEDVVLYYRQHQKSLTHRINAKEIFFQAHRVRRLAASRNGYELSVRVLCIFYFQYIFIKLIPTSAVYPLYFFWRGWRPAYASRISFRPLIEQIKSYLF